MSEEPAYQCSICHARFPAWRQMQEHKLREHDAFVIERQAFDRAQYEIHVLRSILDEFQKGAEAGRSLVELSQVVALRKQELYRTMQVWTLTGQRPQ